MRGVGVRFLLEAAFLIALAIGLGVAELSATTIVVVMALGWLLVCLFELAVWAEGPRFPAAQRQPVVVEAPEPGPEPDETTPTETVEPAAVTEIREPEAAPRRGRFWRRRAAS